MKLCRVAKRNRDIRVRVQSAAGALISSYPEELRSLWQAWQDRHRYLERLLNGCAVRASPCSGLRELAASISLTNEPERF